ncbi:MAG: hypothetical protein AB7O37_05660 [Vicinamibacteria bacterium]
MSVELRRPALVLGALALAFAGSARAQTLDEIVAKNLEARGGLERLESMSSVRMKGTMSMGPGMEGPFTLELRRPNAMRAEFELDGRTSVQAFDGKRGWALPPVPDAEPEPIPDEDAEQIAAQADFDGPLVDWKAKGHQVQLLGREKLGEREVYRLHVTRKDGGTTDLLLDATSFLEVRSESRRVVRGETIEFVSTIGDYREVNGLMVPHSIESGPRGSRRTQRLVFEKIEFDVPLDAARFRMPEPRER